MPSYRQVLLNSTSELRSQADRWDDLWRRSDETSPTVRAEMVAMTHQHFGRASAMRAVGVEQNGKMLAALPLVTAKVARGVVVGSLSSDTAIVRADLLLDPHCDQQTVMDLLVGGLQQLEWPMLWLNQVRLDEPRWQTLLAALKRAGLPVDVRRQQPVGRVAVCQDWQTYFAGRSRNQRKARRRETRIIEAAGPTELEIVTRPRASELDDLLCEGFEIERHSWKGTAGTAVLQQPRLFDFYRHFARELAAGGHLHLKFLKHAGRRIAFLFGWQAKGVAFELKIGCDAAYQHLAPGHQIMMRAIRHYHDQGSIRFVDFLGPVSTWHDSWATDTSPTARIVVALPRRWGRAFFHMYTKWQPRARRAADLKLRVSSKCSWIRKNADVFDRTGDPIRLPTG